MKNSTIKMKFVVIVSGLALLLCCSLKCHAQTDDCLIYKVYRENGKIKEIKCYIEFKHYVKDYDIVHIHMASRRSTFRKIRYIKTAKRKP